jgi:hypothetical protein
MFKSTLLWSILILGGLLIFPSILLSNESVSEAKNRFNMTAAEVLETMPPEWHSQ